MHWPYQRSIHLNRAVAQLFIQTCNKFFISLTNRTHHKIPIDILSTKIKKRLLLDTLIEIEIIVLDIIELNLTIEDIEQKSNQIIYDLICKIRIKLLDKKNTNIQSLTINTAYKYNQMFFEENNYLFQHLLTYLTFGSKHIKRSLFKFEALKTPKYHVKILLEHFVIQVSNTVLLNLLEERNLFFLISGSISSNFGSKSIRELSNFQNNLLSYNWVYYYIYYPQNIYCNQYKVWLLSSRGLIYKYIYANRYFDYLKLSPSLTSSIIYLELQDFIIPKINFLITLLGRLIIYISIEFVNRSIQIFLNQIITRFNDKTEI